MHALAHGYLFWGETPLFNLTYAKSIGLNMITEIKMAEEDEEENIPSFLHGKQNVMERTLIIRGNCKVADMDVEDYFCLYLEANSTKRRLRWMKSLNELVGNLNIQNFKSLPTPRYGVLSYIRKAGVEFSECPTEEPPEQWWRNKDKGLASVLFYSFDGCEWSILKRNGPVAITPILSSLDKLPHQATRQRSLKEKEKKKTEHEGNEKCKGRSQNTAGRVRRF